jgi:hypothetical protein
MGRMTALLLASWLGHEIPHELSGEGLGALHVHVVATAVAGAGAGGAAAHEERRRLVRRHATGVVREAERERDPAVVPGEREGLIRAELPVRRRCLREQRVAAVLVVLVLVPPGVAALHELHQQLPVAHLVFVLLLPRGGRGLRVQRGHVVHVVVVERRPRLIICSRLLEPTLHRRVLIVIVVTVEPGVRRLPLVSGELERGGTMDAAVVFHVVAPATRISLVVPGGGGFPVLIGLLQVHLLHHRLPQPHPRIDEPVRNLDEEKNYIFTNHCIVAVKPITLPSNKNM